MLKMKRMEFLFTLLFVLHVYHDALGQQQVWAYVGDESVSLPCIMEPLGLKSDPSVEWTRDGSEEVLVGGDVRTHMKPDALQTGDLTLFLLKPNIRDNGVYTCVARAGLTEVGSTSVELKVEVRPEQSPLVDKETALKGFGYFVVVVIILCCISETLRNCCLVICCTPVLCISECCKCWCECCNSCCECCCECCEGCCGSRSEDPMPLQGLQ